MWKNNPSSIIDSEIGVIDPLAYEPLVVSVGTGTPKEPDEPETSGPRGIWKDGFIPRLYRALMASMRAKSHPHLGDQRFDISFDGSEPALDDVSAMPEMATSAQEQFASSTELDSLACHLLVSHFYFELESIPRRAGSQCYGVGHILCDLKSNHPAYKILLGRLSAESARFYLDSRPIPGDITDRTFKGRDGNFDKRVEFESIGEELRITLKVGSFQPQNISGSPVRISQRVMAQNLDAYFGQCNHRKRKLSTNINLPARKWRRGISLA